MTERRIPTLDLLVLCRNIVYDSSGYIDSLVEPIHTICLTPNRNNQLVSPSLSLYMRLDVDQAEGMFSFRPQVRALGSVSIFDPLNQAVDVSFSASMFPLQASEFSFEHAFELCGLIFPRPATYTFHVMCRHISLSDNPGGAKAAKLRVIREEPGRNVL